MKSSLDGKDYQVLESIEADFSEMTWTFRLPSNGEVGAGNYAVLPVETFAKMSRQFARADGLLRQWLRGHLDETFKERVECFFDPEPL